MTRILGLFLMLTISQIGLAAENWSSENEAGVVVNQGNAESQAVSLKSLNKYKLTEKDNFALRGEYNQSKGQINGTTELTSENSLVELKYERLISEMFGAFIIGSWSKDNFRGFEQRYEFGPGLSYHFIKSDNRNFFTEQGYLYRRDTAYLIGPATGPKSTINFYRAYFEANNKFNEALSGKIWVETKLNLEDTEDVEVRVEPSLDVILSGNFSLGLAFRYSFDNVPAIATALRVDKMYMTTLKAKF